MTTTPPAPRTDDHDPNSMPVDRARQHIRDHLAPVHETERLGLHEALGRVLSNDIRSPHNVPNHNNSAMDGFALRIAVARRAAPPCA